MCKLILKFDLDMALTLNTLDHYDHYMTLSSEASFMGRVLYSGKIL